jgi:hypothetical protein
MPTPEGVVKAGIDKMLDDYESLGVVMFRFKPVQYGMGKRALDYICCIAGQFVAIEAKRPGETLRPLQRKTALDIFNAGGKVFIVSSIEGLNVLARWLETCKPI